MRTNKTLTNWLDFFANKGVEPELVFKYQVYIERILKHKVPIIFNFDHLTKLLGRTPAYLASVINSSSNHYREFGIKKRSGGIREISVPYPALLEMQYWIYTNILSKIQIHACSHGFAKNKSILTNAKIHLMQENLLKLDLSNFFPSISLGRVIKVFKKLGYTTNVSYYLASICCLDEGLPQGAPTSPCLSNIIAHDLDVRLLKFSKHFGLKYTRYADDITFSGTVIPVKFISYISKIIESEGFEVNTEKTRLYKSQSKKIVTGILVSGETMKVPKEYKRKLRQTMHYIRTYGIASHIAKRKIREPNYIDSLIGKLQFWKSVEPNCDFVSAQINFLKGLKSGNREG